MRTLFVDFETYYSTKEEYTLSDLSVTEYVRDSRFKVHGLAYRFADDERTHWISGDHTIQAWIGSIDWGSTVVVAHNIKFDGSILAWRYGVKPQRWFDTVALAKAVLGENVSGYSLKGLAEYLGLQAKGELKWDGVRDLQMEQERQMAEYCIGDTDICKGIYDKLIGQFPQSQLSPMDWTVRAFIEPRLVLDEKTLAEGVQAEKERREAAIKASGVDKSVLASNKQFAEYLESQGIRVITKVSSRTGEAIPAFARTDEGLGLLQKSNPCLYAARIASKANLLETRGQALLDLAKTGPWPFDVGFSGATQTHRYSGQSGGGGNPQNFTKKSYLRSAVCAPDGYSLVVGDFSSVELRILAWLSGEPKLINAIANETDIYAEFGTAFYGRPVAPWVSSPERNFAKTAILGLGYAMGAPHFKDTVKSQLKQDISEEVAWATVRLYRETYFNVPKLWKTLESLLPLIATGQIGCLYFAPFIKVRKAALVLPSGLEIKYPNLRQISTSYRTKSGQERTRLEWVYDVYKKKYKAEQARLYGGKVAENLCQGLAGELCKEAIIRAEAAVLPCVGQVHDEVLALHKDGPAGAKILKNAMEKAPTWWPTIRIKSEVGYGPNWNEAKH